MQTVQNVSDNNCDVKNIKRVSSSEVVVVAATHANISFICSFKISPLLRLLPPAQYTERQTEFQIIDKISSIYRPLFYTVYASGS